MRINQIPRQIPQQIWYSRPEVSILLGGVLPFGAILIELFFIWYDLSVGLALSFVNISS